MAEIELWRLFNRAIAEKFGEGRDVEADEVMHACLVMAEAYCGQLPARLRREQMDRLIDKLIEIRDGGRRS
jgi:hypothetical protein